MWKIILAPIRFVARIIGIILMVLIVAVVLFVDWVFPTEIGPRKPAVIEDAEDETEEDNDR